MMTDIKEAEVKELQSQIEKHDSEEDEVDVTEAAKKLSEGLLSMCQDRFEHVKKKLDEVRVKQETLYDKMQIENKKLQETFDDVQLDEMFQTVKTSQGKLVTMKKEMVSIHERTLKLQKRVLRLQQIKQKEVLNREQQREQELRREQELIGKPVIS
ncbi:Pallidin [Habropoda laboriosa]|uniref:Biogenesis of lysosome-related organelles complex 1 subunit 6 n=1 Tax=Habropoda laboriosa TaxID=597456 RepID=A0A0L7RCS1_9HYME|nr:PREDICTED: biogenesis of lysosome-related organelles complex 1 subunit 6-like [Habropoda laboriosa]KOC68599.1 Pallidin [Habropoda laboriosa]